MAGSPKRRAACDAVHAALLELADDGQTTLNVVTDHIEAGGSMVTLAIEIGAARATLYNYLKRTYGAELANKLREARREGAAQLMDRAEETLMTAPTDSREGLNKSKFVSDLLRAMAEKSNPDEFGSKTKVTFDLGALHLSAMRERSLRVTATAALPAASETADAEVIESPAL